MPLTPEQRAKIKPREPEKSHAAGLKRKTVLHKPRPKTMIAPVAKEEERVVVEVSRFTRQLLFNALNAVPEEKREGRYEAIKEKVEKLIGTKTDKGGWTEPEGFKQSYATKSIRFILGTLEGEFLRVEGEEGSKKLYPEYNVGLGIGLRASKSLNSEKLEDAINDIEQACKRAKLSLALPRSQVR